MTDALRLAGFAVTAALIAFTLRAAHRPAGASVALAAGMMLFLSAVTRMGEAVETVQALSRQAGLEDGTSAVLLKLAGMAFVTEFAVQSCRDAGEEGLAAKASLCGRVLLMVQTLPLLREIGEIALGLAP